MILRNNEIRLSDAGRDNIIEHENVFYRIDFLQEPGRYVQGGNGIVFNLIDEQNGQELVIKILKIAEQNRELNRKTTKRVLRFEREKEALWIAKQNAVENVIGIEFDGVLQIDGLDFQYYAMQKCDCTLGAYLSNPANQLDKYQKFLLCKKILNGIQGLHEYQIYHRDIKHDNIYFLGNEPLVGDLGLAFYRRSEFRINEWGELIGPTGWFSPEAINKYLVEGNGNPNGFDCIINEKSEIFQLGKLFWYIFQGNLPIGQVTNDDFIVGDAQIFEIIYNMLLYSKPNRSNADAVAAQIDAYLQRN